MSHEQEIQQTRKLLDDYKNLDEETRNKLVNGVEWLAFLQGMAKNDAELPVAVDKEDAA